MRVGKGKGYDRMRAAYCSNLYSIRQTTISQCTYNKIVYQSKGDHRRMSVVSYACLIFLLLGLDLNPMTLLLDLDVHILKTYQRTKTQNEVFKSSLSKV